MTLRCTPLRHLTSTGLVLLLLAPPAVAEPKPTAGEPQTAASAEPASAPPPGLSKEARERARQRFDRGLSLYDAGDYQGALREFRGALDVMRHPIVLYNVALVYARLNSPVECVSTVEELRQGGLTGLDSESQRKLLQVYDDQRARIGRLRIRSNVPGAVIQLNGVDIGQSFVDAPIAAGEHIVSTVASGYIPRRMRVFVPAQAEQEVTFTLQPLQTTLAHLHIVTDVPDVEVSVDGEVVGRTPFPASISFSPGTHLVVLRRAGYKEQKQSVTLDPGGEGHLSFQMQLDPAAMERQHGVLSLGISEPNSLVFINGTPMGLSKTKLSLPLGKHRLKVSSSGFLDYEREVVVLPEGTAARVELMPTSEFLKDYEGQARSQRVWGWVSVGAGAALAGGSVGFLIWNRGEREAAQQDFDEFSQEVRDSANGTCSTATCEARLRSLAKTRDDADDREIFGWIGVGVGAAAAAVGVGLLVWGDDPNRYAPGEESDVFGGLRLEVGLGHAAVSGQF